MEKFLINLLNIVLVYTRTDECLQIHVLPDGSIRVYSRNQENNTSKFPDIVNTLIPAALKIAFLSTQANRRLLRVTDASLLTHSSHCKTKKSSESICGNESLDNEDISGRIPITSCIIDSEAVAWDRAAGRILPFQILATRKRKVCNLFVWQRILASRLFVLISLVLF
ncbi:unnamed protein product [Protopolystoma xenopodis]|uniref:ATP-dependent DNA ligase family profile domain-containing protein n=1 Tax=Protopolystoma xenopodis TaxID=117903 RepID=A0A3S5CME1_9PLAT|nr:unnamed protein product [Protopolystoma xenopodis]